MNSEEMYHEIGHGIIAYFFNGYLYRFEGIISDPIELKEIGLNPNDLAYNLMKSVRNMDEIFDANNHQAGVVDGLTLLGGIAGRSFFGGSWKGEIKDISESNMRHILDFKGSSGDFEIINGGVLPYGFYLFKSLQLSLPQTEVRHAILLRLLGELFLESEIQDAAESLFTILDTNGCLSPDDFKECFSDEYVSEKVKTLKHNFVNGIGKPILID